MLFDHGILRAIPKYLEGGEMDEAQLADDVRQYMDDVRHLAAVFRKAAGIHPGEPVTTKRLHTIVGAAENLIATAYAIMPAAEREEFVPLLPEVLNWDIADAVEQLTRMRAAEARLSGGQSSRE
jgi:hypothetical protein